MSRMPAAAPIDFVGGSAAVCDAVLTRRGDDLYAELGRIAGALLASPHCAFIPEGVLHPHMVEGALLQEVRADGVCFGRYEVAGRAYSVDDLRQLEALAGLTGTLMQVHSLAQRTTHAYAQVEAQLAHQSQILDQIHESVLTLDRMGYITSWNKGAERLFGYTALEAVGRNILFLYADEDQDFQDAFAEQGGRMMEVRRRKKSGEIFWASLSLSPLCDLEDRPTGLIAYLTDITERKLAEERLHHLAYYQELTGLPNRTLFGRLVDQALMVAQRNESTACVLYLDLNRFKLINGTLGPAGGYRLSRPPDQINFLDIIEAVEGKTSTFKCTEIRNNNPCLPKGHCNTGACAVARVMWAADEAWRARLRQTSLADLGTQLTKDVPASLLQKSRDWLLTR